MSGNDFSVILLAAGVGRRLGQGRPAPKVLLDFGGRTLIDRHLAILAGLGASRVTIVTGFMAETLEDSVAALAPRVPVSFVRNPGFRDGSVVSLAAGAATLLDGAAAEPAVVLMDGDVLYDARMLRRLIAAPGENILLTDPHLDPGDEPVKICFDKADTIVDFRKRPEFPHVRHGESVGFFRFSAAMARKLAELARAYSGDQRASLEYEEAIRELILAEPGRFYAADVGDLPWTEIDFPEDIERARDRILPQLEQIS